MYIDPEGSMPKWAKWVVGGLAIAGLVVATVLTFGAAVVGAAMLTGSIVSGTINALDQLHDGDKFDFTELAISTLSGMAYGAVVASTGGAGAGFGKLTVAGASGTNYIQSWIGMSDDVYFGVNLSLNIASAVGTFAGNVYMKYADISGNINPGRKGKPLSRYSTLDDKGVKQYRFFDSQGNAWFDKDFRHAEKMKFPHYHGWNDGIRVVEHWSIWKLLKWLIGI